MAIQAQLYSENLGFHYSSNPQDLVMDKPPPCGLHRFQQPQHNNNNMQVLQQRNQNAYQPISFSQNPAAHIENQGLDINNIDRFIHLQSERLRWALQQQRSQQLALILREYGTKAQFLLKQKDEEIAKAANRRMELECFLKRMETENREWQRLAKENEAMVLSLNERIEQMREAGCSSTNRAGDAESCCDVIIENRGNRGGEEEVRVEVQQEKTEQNSRKGVCKGCNSGCSCIVILPCRHICVCKACEPFLNSCPVCGMHKKAAVEALF